MTRLGLSFCAAMLIAMWCQLIPVAMLAMSNVLTF